MSIQPGRSMVIVLRESLHKLECSGSAETPDQAELKRILRRRIAEIESVQRPTAKFFGQAGKLGDTF